MTKVQQIPKPDNLKTSPNQAKKPDTNKIDPKLLEKVSKLSNDLLKETAKRYKRIGTDYYAYIPIQNAKGETNKILKKWTKNTILEDHGRKILKEIEKFYSFTLVPDNTPNYKRNINGNYNLYEPIKYRPQRGNYKKTEEFLEHIFGSYLNIGLDFLTLLYLKPTEKLPALCLVSKKQKTGKSTFLHWLVTIFGTNAVILGNEDFNSNFNTSWASKLIVGIDESFIEKRVIKEKIKRLVTDDKILAEKKGKDKEDLNFFGKFILLSNNEDNFIQMDKEDNRFFVLKIPPVEKENPFLLEELKQEIPAFLYFLQKRKLYHKKESRLWFRPELYQTDALKKVIKNTKTLLENTMIDYLTELIDTINYIKETDPEFVDMEVIKITPTRLADALKDKIRFSNGLHIKIKQVFKSWELEPAKKPARYQYPFFKVDYLNGNEERVIEFRSEVGRFFTIPFKKINELNEE